MTDLPRLLDKKTLAAELGVSEAVARTIMKEIPREADGRVHRHFVKKYLDACTFTAEGFPVLYNPTSVYIARDKDGRVLYVGITRCSSRRLEQHERTSQWWSQAATIELRHLRCRELAELTEARLIDELSPAFNKLGGIYR